jgi:hypothetical protein
MSVIYVIASIAVLAVHVSHSRVGQECYANEGVSDPKIPTPFDSQCYLTNSGAYRAINFTIPTTTLSFDTKTRPWSGKAYSLIYLPGIKAVKGGGYGTGGRLATDCQTDFVGKDVREWHVCEATRIRAMSEMLNDFSSNTLAGGCNVAFLVWLSLHLSAGFAMFALPPMYDSVKQVLLPIWYLLGYILVTAIYFDDDFFHMNVPLNNILLSYILQTFMVVMHFLWAKVSESRKRYKEVAADEASTVHGSLVHTSHPHVTGTETVTDSLFQGQFQRGPQTRFSLTPFNTVTNKPAPIGNHSTFMPYHGVVPSVNGYLMDVFEDKWNTFCVMELTYVELAFTLPSLVVVFFVIGNFVTMDWFLQALYMRTFFICSLLAIAERIRGMGWRHYSADANDALANHKPEIATRSRLLPIHLFINLCAVYIIIYMLLDFMTTMKESVWQSSTVDIGLHGAKTFTMFFHALLWILFSVQVLYNLTGIFMDLFPIMISSSTHELQGDSHDSRFVSYTYLYIVQQVVILSVRILAVLIVFAPDTWYGPFDKRDVTLATI